MPRIPLAKIPILEPDGPAIDIRDFPSLGSVPPIGEYVEAVETPFDELPPMEEPTESLNEDEDIAPS